MTSCPACEQSVPSATFCGNCGANLAAPVTPWSTLLRPRVYATAPHERLAAPRVSSSYLPRLPGPMRTPFRAGLIIVLIAMVALALLSANGPLGVTATLGWPLIFLIYAVQTDVFRDLPARILVIAMVLGVAGGVGWWLMAGKVLAGNYGITTGSGLLLAQMLDVGFLITLGGVPLMLLPAVITRFLPVDKREAVDGFVVGAFGALSYQCAATMTVVAPQVAEGLINEQSTGRMLQDAFSYGVLDPIVTTAAGGLLGLLLWFTPRPGALARRARTVLIICAASGTGIYLASWGIGSFGAPPYVDLAFRLVLAALALLLIRCGLQVALLHEAPDASTGEPILCVHCEQVVPDMAFCPACGAAARASSRSSRRLRHDQPPTALV